MNKLLLSLLALSLWACSQEKMEDLQNPDEQPKQALAQGEITVDGSSPRNLELKKLYERERLKQEKLRTLNGAFSQYNPLNSLIKSVLDRNMFILNGSTYQIGNKDKSGQTGYLYTNARGVVLIGNRGGDFYLRSMPASTGIPYLISQGKAPSEKYLGAGVITLTNQSIPLLRSNNDLFGAGWDIIPTESGLVFECDMIYTKNASEPASFYNIEKRVLTSGAMNAPTSTLEAYDKSNSKQVFSITPQGSFKVLGIRYYSDINQIQSTLYSLDEARLVHDSYAIADSLVGNSADLDAQMGLRMSITKLSDFVVTRTYENTTHQEVSWDVFFDETVNNYSIYKEKTGITMPQVSNARFHLPTIKKQKIVCNVKGSQGLPVKYTSQQHTRKLDAVLHALVSPRTKATISYTYSKYRVKIPYIVYLSPTNDENKHIRVLGVWEGDIYTEHDEDRHYFSKVSLDNNNEDVIIIDDGDDEVIDFSFTTAELERFGYIDRSELRAVRQPKRIKL